VAGASIKTITPGLLRGIRLVGRIEVSKAELKLWPPNFCRSNACGLIKNTMGFLVSDYPGLLIGLVRVGFCEALTLSSEQDQSDQRAHPWLFPKTLHVLRVTRVSASMGCLGAAMWSTLWRLSVPADWLDACGSDEPKAQHHQP
jgi:hypothetical protein